MASDDQNKSRLRHVRIVTRRAGRRITDAEGSSHTLCGAEPTEWDILRREASRYPDWLTCDACRQLMEL